MSDRSEASRGDTGGGGVVKSPQDFAAGLFLVALASVALWASSKLDMGTMRSIGPGMLPHVTAWVVAAFGVLLVVMSFLVPGTSLDRWHLRGPVFVLGSALLFAWTVRPLGLVIAGPLTLLFASFADKQTRLVEVLIFAVVMTAFCIGLFGYLLNLPIPIKPTSLPVPFDTLFAR